MTKECVCDRIFHMLALYKEILNKKKFQILDKDEIITVEVPSYQFSVEIFAVIKNKVTYKFDTVLLSKVRLIQNNLQRYVDIQKKISPKHIFSFLEYCAENSNRVVEYINCDYVVEFFSDECILKDSKMNQINCNLRHVIKDNNYSLPLFYDNQLHLIKKYILVNYTSLFSDSYKISIGHQISLYPPYVIGVL